VGGLDFLTLGGVAAKFAWVSAGLMATGFSLHAALGVTPLGTPELGRPIVLAATALAAAILVRLAWSAVELAGGAMEAPALLPLVWSVQQAAIVSTLMGAVALVLGAIWSSRLALAVGALIAALAFGLTGHAQGDGAPPLAAALVALHVLLASFWATAPLSLWPRARLNDAALAVRHRRIGMIALAAVPVLVIAGGILAFWFGGNLGGLIGSPYGAAIASKAFLAAAAVAVGAWNRLVLAARLTQDPANARQALRTAMAVDAGLFLGAAVAVTLATTIAAPAPMN